MFWVLPLFVFKTPTRLPQSGAEGPCKALCGGGKELTSVRIYEKINAEIEALLGQFIGGRNLCSNPELTTAASCA